MDIALVFCAGGSGVADFQPFRLNRHFLHLVDDGLLTTHQQRLPQPGALDDLRGAHGAWLLSLGKNEALRRFTQACVDGLHGREGGVEPRPERFGVGLHIGDGLAGDPFFHRSARHSQRHGDQQSGVKGSGNDIVHTKLEVAAVSASHFVGHFFLGKLGDGLGCRDFHTLRNPTCPAV